MSHNPTLPPALQRLVDDYLWDVDIAAMPWWKYWSVKVVRILYAIVRDILEGQLSLRAMGLVYTTLLSMVPLLAISFSVLKAFGVHNQIEPMLMNLLAPLGEKGTEIAQQIVEFVDNVQVGVLGFVGLVFLFYTVVSLMRKIERAFNYVWHIGIERSLAQRFRDYISVLMIGPVLVFSSIGITASVVSAPVVEKYVPHEVSEGLIAVSGLVVPYLMIMAAFTFIYFYMPNTKVRLRSAFLGGVIAGVLWNTVGWGFTSFVVGTAKYAAIYSTFATLVLFMIWIYLGWLILLIGACIAFYDQYPEYLRTSGDGGISSRIKEKLALLTAFFVTENYYSGEPGWSIDGLARRIGVPSSVLEPIAARLVACHLLARTDDSPPLFMPAHPPEKTTVAEIIEAVRSADESELTPERLPAAAPVERALAGFDKALTEELQSVTLKSLVVDTTSAAQ
ncbi:MAG: YihY family inner membrane protein [Alphaproteobacteria bacterium]|nr:YihY family inner membrane protein [Alphaproteobacteria bacterium]